MSLRRTDFFEEIWDTAKALVDEHKIPQPPEKRLEVAETMLYADNASKGGSRYRFQGGFNIRVTEGRGCYHLRGWLDETLNARVWDKSE